MRILSQTGTVDLPYESIGIRRDTEINAIPIADSNPQERCWALAEYSTDAGAKEVMERLQEAYIQGDKYFQFPQDSEVEVAK